MTSASTVLHTEFGAFCSVCQSHLSLEEEDFGDACGGEGIGDDDAAGDDADDRVPVERLSLGDWRQLHDATPGRNPTCGEIARFSERVAK